MSSESENIIPAHRIVDAQARDLVPPRRGKVPACFNLCPGDLFFLAESHHLQTILSHKSGDCFFGVRLG